MAFSMFQASVPVCTQILGCHVGDHRQGGGALRGEESDEAWLLTDRLYPDMFPLARQFRQCSDFGRNIPGRLAGGELPSFAATDDTSFAAVKARVEKSLDYVKGFTPAQIDGTEDKDINWTQGQRQMSFKGRAYLLHFCCRTSISTPRPRTTSCAIAAWNWASATSSDRSDGFRGAFHERVRAATLGSEWFGREIRPDRSVERYALGMAAAECCVARSIMGSMIEP